MWSVFRCARFVPRSVSQKMFNFQSASLACLRFHCYEARPRGGRRGQSMLCPLDDDDGDCLNAEVDDHFFKTCKRDPSIRRIHTAAKWCVSICVSTEVACVGKRPTKTMFLFETFCKATLKRWTVKVNQWRPTYLDHHRVWRGWLQLRSVWSGAAGGLNTCDTFSFSWRLAMKAEPLAMPRCDSQCASGWNELEQKGSKSIDEKT